MYGMQLWKIKVKKEIKIFLKKKLLHSGRQRMSEGLSPPPKKIYIYKGHQLFAVGHQHADRALEEHP